MERKKSKKGNKEEGGKDGESCGEGSVAYKGNGGVQSVRTSRAMCVSSRSNCGSQTYGSRSWGSFSRVLSFFFLCYTSIFSNGDFNFFMVVAVYFHSSTIFFLQ